MVDSARTGHGGRGDDRITVLAIVADAASRALLPKVITDDLLLMTDDLAEGLTLAESRRPDAAFIEIDIGEGAGLAMIHHLKAVAPQSTVFALASLTELEAAANAVALGGAGLLLMPVGGDEILSSLATVRARLAEQAMIVDLEQAATLHSRAAGWMARIAELADCPSSSAAAQQLIDVLLEATGAEGAAVYLDTGEKKNNELLRVATSSRLEHLPPFGMEPDILEHTRRERLLVVPLALRTLRVGHVVLLHAAERVESRSGPTTIRPTTSRASRASRIDGLVKLLVTQATAAFALLAERELERAGGAVMKDPGSSAYSFTYYVDVAGREIDKARRFGRRFAIATVAFEGTAPMSPPEMADLLLRAARDTDVLARVDEHEFHILMPETDGLGAHACRRRVLARMGERGERPQNLLVGIATFPHDGQDLGQLLRVARRRAEATRGSIVHRLRVDQTSLLDLLDVVAWDIEPPASGELMAPWPLELSLSDAAALATAAVQDAMRGGATLLAVAHHEGLSLGSAVRLALGSARENVTLHAIDVRASQGEDIEALSIIAEHGAYALIGRNQGGILRGFHAADPLLSDVLAERLGRAAGLRIFP